MNLHADPFLDDAELFLLEAGLKGAIKREKIALADVDALAGAYRARGHAVAVDGALRYGSGHTDGHAYGEGDFTTVFVGRDAAAAERARQLSREEAEARGAARDAAIAELGALLGYPPCCVAAFREQLGALPLALGRAALHLAAWHRTTGPPDPLLNTWGAAVRLTSHVPCSYRCAATATLAARVRDAFAARHPEAMAEDARLRRRPLLWWDAERFVAFEGAWDAAGAFRYRAWEACGRDRMHGARRAGPAWERVEALLARGDGFRWRRGEVAVLAGEAVLARLADLEPLRLPVLLDWSGRVAPSTAAPRLACLDPPAGRAEPDGWLALLAADLRAQGLPVAHLAAEGPGAAADPPPGGATTALLARPLPPAALKALGEAGVRRVWVGPPGEAPRDGLDQRVDLAGLALDAARRHAVVQVLRGLEPSEAEGPAPPPPAAPGPLPAAPAAAAPRLATWAARPPGAASPSDDHPDPFAPSHLPAEDDAATPEAFAAALARRLDELARAGARPERVLLACDAPAPLLLPLVEALAARPDRPELLLQARPDHLLAAAPAWEAAALAAERAGVLLAPYLVAFDSFDPATLAGLGRAHGPADNLAAAALLRDLAALAPAAFAPARYATHGFAAFTPWTTEDSLAADAAGLREAGLHALCGDVLAAYGPARAPLPPAAAHPAWSPAVALARRLVATCARHVRVPHAPDVLEAALAFAAARPGEGWSRAAYGAFAREVERWLSPRPLPPPFSPAPRR